jgi:hypothetical protein
MRCSTKDASQSLVFAPGEKLRCADDERDGAQRDGQPPLRSQAIGIAAFFCQTSL